MDPLPAAGDGRLTDPHYVLGQLAPALATIVMLASRCLPDGWLVEIVPGAGATPPRPHAGIAVDIQLIADQGRRLATTSRSESDVVYQAYKRFADQVFCVQRRHYPALDGRLAWGGNWTSCDGRWKVAHFDLGGWRGRGSYQPPVVIDGRHLGRPPGQGGLE
jgi:hypothetical protein